MAARVRARHLVATAAVALAVAPVACAETDEPDVTPAPLPDASVDRRAPDAAPPGQDAPVTPEVDAGRPDASDCKTAPPSAACGVAPQCGCSAAETCDVLDLAGNVGCAPFGKAPPGHPCTATAGCAKGATCVYGTCHVLCGPGATCADLGAGSGACVQVSSDGKAVPNLAVCRVACAPHDRASCFGATAAGTGVCAVFDDGTTDCVAGGDQADGQPCSDDASCGPGLVCVTPSGGKDVCKRWCRVGKTDCGGSVPCRGFSTKVMVGTVEYGACP